MTIVRLSTGRNSKRSLPKYFAAVRHDTERAKSPGCNRLPKRRVHDDMVYWPLVLLPEIEEGDKLRTELCEQTVVCLKMEFAFGLVLRKNGDDWERIGDINTFRGYCREEKKVKKGQLGEGKFLRYSGMEDIPSAT
ncbi:hypothetical protein QBC38DRAFT_461307 [Podospora fimiseda]|uniref:Uncharacterized protein n=1 Tax=Podospora fimiseda TaxID=252190 RepID=A0AAN7BGJ2_9PEZI|nr:hypothetical protein QBC38DRAFT_461307 [Podospora fimiseda]